VTHYLSRDLCWLRISRHKDLNILLKAYYRESVDQIAARI